MLTQGLGDLTPITWGAIDLLAITAAFWLHYKDEPIVLTVAAILSCRLFLHAWQWLQPLDLYTYYLSANLLYGLLLASIAAWNYYLSRY